MKYLFLLSIFSFSLFGATSGPNIAGTGADDSAIGTLTWTNPGNITSHNATYATNTSSAGNATHYLKGTNFGFSIPAGATIDGITVEIFAFKSGSGGGSYSDSTIKIVKADGTIGSTNKATSTQLGATPGAYITYGGSSDLWGETWTASDINDADFGVVGSWTSATNTSAISVDDYRITIAYTAASTTSKFFFGFFP